MEGAQGCAWPAGGRLPVIVAEWLNGTVWPRQAHSCGSVKSGHEITTVREWPFFPPFFFACQCFFHPPDMSFNSALRIRQRAEFNLGKVMVISRWDYIDWLDIIYILKMGKPARKHFLLSAVTQLVCLMYFGHLTNVMWCVLPAPPSSALQHQFIISPGGYTTLVRQELSSFNTSNLFLLPTGQTWLLFHWPKVNMSVILTSTFQGGWWRKCVFIYKWSPYSQVTFEVPCVRH